MVIALLAASCILTAVGLWHVWTGWAANADAARIERRLTQGLQEHGMAGAGRSRTAKFLSRVGHRLSDPSSVAAIGARAAVSGGRDVAYRLIALRFILAGGLAVAGLVLVAGGVLRGPLASISPFVAALAVYFGAKPMLGMMTARRQSEMMRELPFLLDVLVLMLRSGASLDQAFRQVARLDPRAMPQIVPITAELVADVEGGMSYENAFHRWGDKLGSEHAQELANLFIQCLVSGLEISKRLKQFSALHVERRLLAARETAGRRLTHLTVATMIFFIPPLIMLLAAPVMHNTLNALKVFHHG